MMSEVSSLVALHTTISLSPFYSSRGCRDDKISDFYFNSLKKIGDDGEDKMRKEKKYIFMHFVLRWLFADKLSSNLFRISISALLNEIHFNFFPSIKFLLIRFVAFDFLCIRSHFVFCVGVYWARSGNLIFVIKIFTVIFKTTPFFKI